MTEDENKKTTGQTAETKKEDPQNQSTQELFRNYFQNTLKSMSTQSKLLVITLLLAVLAIPITLNLTQQQQDLRQQASENETQFIATDANCQQTCENAFNSAITVADQAYGTCTNSCDSNNSNCEDTCRTQAENALEQCTQQCSTDTVCASECTNRVQNAAEACVSACTGANQQCNLECETKKIEAYSIATQATQACASQCESSSSPSPTTCEENCVLQGLPDAQEQACLSKCSNSPVTSHATYNQCISSCESTYTDPSACLSDCQSQYACANYAQESKCLDEIALSNDVICRSERFSGAYCPGANDICCVFEDIVPGGEDQTQYCSDFYGTCTNTTCPNGTYKADNKSCDNDSSGSICCLSDGSSGPGGGDDNVGGNPPDDPNITCGDCVPDSCSSGFGSCEVCTDNTSGQTFSQACSENPDDSIYTESCGKGSYTDDTHTKRSGDPTPFTHVACTGDSVCDGGPNPDGTYWCIEKFPEQDDEVCKDGKHYDAVDESTCSTGCATYYTCPSGDDALGTCVDSSFCGGITQPGDDEEYPDCDVTSDLNPNGTKCPFDSSCNSKYRDENEICTSEPDDSGSSQNDYPYVTKINPSTNKAGTTSIPVTLTITGDADKYTVYIHRGNPKKGDTVQQSYDPSNVPTTQFVILGSTTSNKFTFNSPTQAGTYKIAINASNNPSGNQGELVCAWHEEVFERASNGAIDLNNPVADCDNGLINFTVEQSGGQQPQGNTSTTNDGLTVTAKPSKNCGGHIEVTWTDTAGTPVSNGY